MLMPEIENLELFWEESNPKSFLPIAIYLTLSRNTTELPAPWDQGYNPGAQLASTGQTPYIAAQTACNGKNQSDKQKMNPTL